ncbi:MAG: MoxR-like ATPase [Arenicella sp.]|jgi:MoxR-like ATPase
MTDIELASIEQLVARLKLRLSKAVRGRDDVIELIIVALLADGHVLLEDYPGSGKTTLARALGEAISKPKQESAADRAAADFPCFRRIQFTPDLLPSDVTGSSVFLPEKSTFEFHRGPIFAHVVLADEINRTSPKVQAALLEAMAEKQVTIDNQTHQLDSLFFVIATQNPLDLAGTYPLPRPQLDRFLFKLEMNYIDRDDELAVLADYPVPRLERAAAQQSVTRDELIAARIALREGVFIHSAIRQALVDAARAVRDHEQILSGVSTRALVQLLPALQARAVIHGRDYVSPKDVEVLLPPVFDHRVEAAAGVEHARDIIAGACAPQIEMLSRTSLSG